MSEPKTVTLQLSLPEAKLLAYLLEIAQDEFGSHGCSDLPLIDAGLSTQDAKLIVQSWKRWLPEEPPLLGIDYQLDWQMMLLFKTMLEKIGNFKTSERR